MEFNRKIVAALLATTALSFGIAAQAQPGQGGMGGMSGMSGMGGMSGMEGMRGKMADPAARAEQRLARMKGELKITAQQEPLWQAYAEKMQSVAGQGMKSREKVKDVTMSAPERMSQMTSMMKEHLAAMEDVNASFKRVYDTFSPEQKAIADKQAANMGQMRPGGPGGQGSAGKQGAPASGAAQGK